MLKILYWVDISIIFTASVMLYFIFLYCVAWDVWLLNNSKGFLLHTGGLAFFQVFFYGWYAKAYLLSTIAYVIITKYRKIFSIKKFLVILALTSQNIIGMYVFIWAHYESDTVVWKKNIDALLTWNGLGEFISSWNLCL